MNLIKQARKDALAITSNLSSGFGREIAITPVGGGTTVNIIGLATKHHLGFDPTTGVSVNVKNAHITFHESLLTDQGYVVRNAKGEVSLYNHKVVTADSTGLDKEYVIREFFPDESLGLIVCILGDFES